MNRKLNIKLILSADEQDPLRKKDPFMPLSLAILASVAPDHNYSFTDMLWDEVDYEELADIVGISVRMSAENAAFRIADQYRAMGIKVVMGGPQASSNPYEALKHADTIVIGEGEKLWPVVLNDFQNHQLKEFYVCSPGTFNANGHSVFQLGQLPELKDMPVPRRDLFKKKYTFDMVFASRGCAINCDFCSVSKLFGKTYRFKLVEDVVKEIESFKGYYYLIDDTVFGRPSTYGYYLSLYDKISKFKKIRYWTGQANLDAASHEQGQKVIRKAVESGFVYAAIGMESINAEVLKKSGSYSKMGIKQGEDSLTRMKENIRFIQDQGILISAWFALGYEDDNLETYEKTFEFCKEMHLLPVFTPVSALTGTDLYIRLMKENKLQDSNTNLTNVQHHSMTNEQVLSALEHIIRKGYSLMNIVNRTFFFARKFAANKGNSINDIIHKTIFTFVTQRRMKQIVMCENNRLRKNIEEITPRDV
jgi:radical SAM superfamily enzyme YgiQ (UPF0313 family)